jgi:hypothetical protein
MMIMEASLVLLCGLLMIEMVVLSAVIREVQRIPKQGGAAHSERDSLTDVIGARMPAFSLRMVDSGAVVSDRNLRGKYVMLLFMTKQDAQQLGSRVFLSIVFGLSAQAEECLYIVCEGTDDDCRWLRKEYESVGRDADRVKFLVSDSALRARLGVSFTPCCVVFDEDETVLKVGNLVAQQNEAAGASTLREEYAQ